MNPLALLTKIAEFASGINFGAIFSMFQAVWANVVKYWQYWLIAVLFAFNGLTGYELKTTKDKLQTEVAAHVKDITDFKNAQAAANQRATEIKQTLTKESKANADQADANYAILLSKYRASLLRFSANKGHPGSTSNSKLPTTKSSDGPSESTELPKSLTITGTDAEVCAVNTARLQAVHDWAVTLPKAIK